MDQFVEIQAINHKAQDFLDAPVALKTTRHKIPLAAKVAGAAFLAILIPIYLHTYGPANFLWFCDAALIFTVAGMWLESSLLISMCAVGILIPQCLWLVDFGGNLLGFHLTGLTSYMFDRQLPLFTRGLSLFHGWLPLLLVWLLFRLGYDKRALFAWTGLAAGLVLVCYFFTPPAGAHLANPNLPININYLYGFNDQQPQALGQPKPLCHPVAGRAVARRLSTHPPGLAQNLRRVTASGQPESPHSIFIELVHRLVG